MLRQFRVLAFDYFEGVQYPSWMSAGTSPVMDDTAQTARQQINHLLGEVLISLERFRIPHVIRYQPAPTLGGYVQNVDIILNIFSLREFQIGPERVFDTVDRAIGAYERETGRLHRNLFNPLYWLCLVIVWLLRLPFRLLGVAGFDAHKVEGSLLGRILKLLWGIVLGCAAVVPAILEIHDHWNLVGPLLHKYFSLLYSR